MTLKEKVMHRYALSEQGYRDLIVSSVCCAVRYTAQILTVMIMFLYIADIMGTGFSSDNPYDFDLEGWQYVVLMIAAIAVTAVAYRLEYDATYMRTYRMSGQKRIELAEKTRRLPLSYFSRKDPTDLTTRMLNDVYSLEQAMSHWFPQLIGGFAFAIIAGIAVLIWSPLVGIAMLWPVPIALAISLSARGLQDRTNREMFAVSLEASESVQECLESMRDLRANDAQKQYVERLKGTFSEWTSKQIRSELAVGTFVSLAQLMLKFGLVTTAAVSGTLLANGDVTIFAFMFAMFVCARIVGVLDTGLQNLTAMTVASNNMERMQEIMDAPVQKGTEDFRPDGYDIVFDHVGFSYDRDTEVLKDVSFIAEQGRVTALIGPSGEGKTTCAKLAARFWDADAGRITIGGIDVSTVDPETLLSAYSIVFQDVVLFNNTVMENIRIGRKGATDEEVLAAARAAQCDDFVERLPDGYGSMIGENGSKLSGGERQRISIARALLKDAPVILLDEATASLDTESESRVQAAISELVRGRTVLIIAHRMRTVEGADRIVVLENGTVAEQGAPDELLAKDGVFAKMDRLQKGSDGWSI